MAETKIYYSTITQTVAAGAEVQIARAGNYCRCIASDQAYFGIKVDGGPECRFEAGLGFELKNGDRFQVLTVVNKSGANPLTVTLGIGQGSMLDSRFVLSGGVTVATPTGFASAADVSIAAGANGVVVAANSNRKGVVIGALSTNTANVRLRSGAAASAEGPELAPGEKITLATTAEVRCYNPSGAGQTLTVAEIS